MRMGRHPDPRPSHIRADWVYVGAQEATALAGVSQSTLYRWIAARELQPEAQAFGLAGGRPRSLYRLDHVLALSNKNRR